MTRRVYLYFAVTFLLGAIIGAAALFFYAWNTGHWHRGFSRARLVEHLQRDLDLSPAQVQQINQILDDEAKKYGDLQKQVEPQFQAIREDTRDRIRQILNPPQTAKFNDLVRRWDERRRARHR
jgi:Spy/CpxP family protein refolding chaperone